MGLLVAGLAGCSGDGLRYGAKHGTGGAAGISGTSGAGGSTGGTAGVRGTGGVGTSGAGGGFGGAICTGVPASSQIPRMKSAAYDAVIRDLLGVTTIASLGNQPPSTTLAPDSTGSLTDISWSSYLAAADAVAAEVMAGPNESRFISCDAAMDSCLTDTITTFGRKAFRRPLTVDEVARFMRLNNLTPKGTPAEVAEAILRAFLSSPSFIMLPELGSETEGAAIKLTSYEVATRLSFLLWNSIPDDTLNVEANAGRLTTRDQISAQAQRMLMSDKAAAVVAGFHHDYLGIENGSHWLNGVTHDPAKYPNYSPASAAPLMAEIDAFLADVVLKGGGSFKDLFLSNVAFVTSDTAAIYGLDPAKFTTQPVRVELDASTRPGILTRAGFLSTFSHYDLTAPILRGAFITQDILGIPVGVPDPSFMMPAPGTYTTTRQQVEALTAPQPCKTCHGPLINPPGFVLERYNAVGSWQDTDPLGGAIDGTATVSFSATDTKTITTPLELMTEIGNRPEAKHLYAEQFVSYATGRVPNPIDACTVDQLSSNLADPRYPVTKLIADYTQADSFRLRTVGN